MWLLGCLGRNGENGDAVFRDECVEFVIGTMKFYNSHIHAQEAGSEYFKELSKFTERKEYLLEKSVDKLLVEACHLLRNRGGPAAKQHEKSAKEAVRQLYAP